MEDQCNESFLEEVCARWINQRAIDTYTFPRILELAKRCQSIERIEEENEWLRARMDKMAGGQINSAGAALQEAVA